MYFVNYFSFLFFVFPRIIFPQRGLLVACDGGRAHAEWVSIHTPMGAPNNKSGVSCAGSDRAGVGTAKPVRGQLRPVAVSDKTVGDADYQGADEVSFSGKS